MIKNQGTPPPFPPSKSFSNHAGIYIHIPFCIRKCPYCDFYSITDISLTKDFVAALLQELKLRADNDLKVDTIYLGGGTPSILLPEYIESVLVAVKHHFNLLDNAQVTMEINPGTLSNGKKDSHEGKDIRDSKNKQSDKKYFQETQKRLIDIMKTGVNRLSIGVQSFRNEKLAFLNRIHSAEDAVETIQQARQAGFHQIGIDLMYGVPGDSFASWQSELDTALQLNLEHLSCYMLTYEPGTPLFDAFQKCEVLPVEDEEVVDLFRLTSSHLEENGFCHYEISNFARRISSRGGRCNDSGLDKDLQDLSYESLHNRKYWNMTSYLGFGPSAHSYDGRRRFRNVSDVKRYIERLEKGGLATDADTRESLTMEQKMIEMVMLGLRTKTGINVNQFEQISGMAFGEMFADVINRLSSLSWGGYGKKDKTPEGKELQNGETYFALSRDGWCFLDTVTSWFVDKL